MPILAALILAAHPAAAQELPPSNLAMADLDGDGLEDLAIGAPSDCGRVDLWRGATGPFPEVPREGSDLRTPDLTLVASECIPELGEWLDVVRGSLVVRTAGGDFLVDAGALSRARGGTLVLDVAGLTTIPLEGFWVEECHFTSDPKTGLEHMHCFVSGSKTSEPPECEPCCGPTPCCIGGSCE